MNKYELTYVAVQRHALACPRLMGDEAAKIAAPLLSCCDSSNKYLLNDSECSSDSFCCKCHVRAHDTSHEENLEDDKEDDQP